MYSCFVDVPSTLASPAWPLCISISCQPNLVLSVHSLIITYGAVLLIVANSETRTLQDYNEKISDKSRLLAKIK